MARAKRDATPPDDGADRLQKLQRALAQTEARLRDALAERDRALADLATARARLESVKVAAAHAGEPEVPRYPASAGAGPAPLRYVVVDAANDQLKALLGPLHGGLRQLAKRVLPKGS